MIRPRDQESIPFPIGEKMSFRVDYVAVISTFLINLSIFISAAIACFGLITPLNFISSFVLTPIGLLALQYSRRAKIMQVEKKWKSEFLFSLFMSSYISYFLYTSAWSEYRIPSLAFIFLVTICFYWIDPMIKLFSVKRAS